MLPPPPPSARWFATRSESDIASRTPPSSKAETQPVGRGSRSVCDPPVARVGDLLESCLLRSRLEVQVCRVDSCSLRSGTVESWTPGPGRSSIFRQRLQRFLKLLELQAELSKAQL